MDELLTQKKERLDTLMLKRPGSAKTLGFCEKLLTETRSRLGPQSRDTARVYAWLGRCQLRRDMRRQAAQCFRRAVRIAEHPKNRGCVEAAEYLLDLAEIEHGRNPELTELLFRRAALAVRDALPPDSDMVRDLLIRYADLPPTETDSPQGRANRALALSRYMYGAGYLGGTAVWTAALEFQQADRVREAEILMTDALQTFVRIMGPYHSQVGEILGHLGDILVQTGDSETAVRFQERRRVIVDRMQNPSPDDRIECRQAVADASEKAGDRQRYLAALRDLLTETEAEYHNRSETATVLDRLGLFHLEAEQYDDAIAAFNEAVGMMVDSKEEGMDNVAYADHLAVTYAEKGKQDGERYWHKALGVYRSMLKPTEYYFGRKSEVMAEVLSGMASVCSALGRPQDARRHYEHCLRICKALGIEGEKYIETLGDLGTVLLDTKQKRTGLYRLRYAARLAAAQLGPAHPILIPVLNNLALAEASAGGHELAVECQQRAVRLSADTYGPRDDHGQSLRENLAQLLALDGRPEEAVAEYEQLIADNNGSKDAERLQKDYGALKAGRAKPIAQLWRMDVGPTGLERARRVLR